MLIISKSIFSENQYIINHTLRPILIQSVSLKSLKKWEEYKYLLVKLDWEYNLNNFWAKRLSPDNSQWWTWSSLLLWVHQYRRLATLLHHQNKEPKIDWWEHLWCFQITCFSSKAILKINFLLVAFVMVDTCPFNSEQTIQLMLSLSLCPDFKEISSGLFQVSPINISN